MREKIAIIGGAGFLGTRMAKRMTGNYDFDVCDISRKDSHNIFIDVEDKTSLKKLSDYDCIINLAAVHRDDVRPLTRYDDVNVVGAKNICESAIENNINKIIFTSSVAIYGFAPANTNESGEPNYFNDYGRTKYLAEQVYKKWQSDDPSNRTLIIVRPTVIFGEGNRGNVFNLLKQIASKKFLMIGDGKNKKSMAYVENVAAFLEYCLAFNSGIHIYNYIDKPDFAMNELVSQTRKNLFGKSGVGLRIPAFAGKVVGIFFDLLASLTGKNFPISSIRIKKFIGTTQFDSSIPKNTNFKPPIKLEDALSQTLVYEFIDDNSDKQTFDTE